MESGDGTWLSSEILRTHVFSFMLIVFKAKERVMERKLLPSPFHSLYTRSEQAGKGQQNS